MEKRLISKYSNGRTTIKNGIIYALPDATFYMFPKSFVYMRRNDALRRYEHLIIEMSEPNERIQKALFRLVDYSYDQYKHIYDVRSMTETGCLIAAYLSSNKMHFPYMDYMREMHWSRVDIIKQVVNLLKHSIGGYKFIINNGGRANIIDAIRYVIEHPTLRGEI